MAPRAGAPVSAGYARRYYVAAPAGRLDAARAIPEERDPPRLVWVRLGRLPVKVAWIRAARFNRYYARADRALRVAGAAATLAGVPMEVFGTMPDAPDLYVGIEPPWRGPLARWRARAVLAAVRGYEAGRFAARVWRLRREVFGVRL